MGYSVRRATSRTSTLLFIKGVGAGSSSPEKMDQMPALFTTTTISLMVAAAVLAALSIPIRRMMAKTPGEVASYMVDQLVTRRRGHTAAGTLATTRQEAS